MRTISLDEKNGSPPVRDLLGAHFSIAGGVEFALEEAARYRCAVCQIFTKNANTWRERTLSNDEIERFRVDRKMKGVHTVVSHTAYLINPASSEEAVAAQSRTALIGEMTRSAALELSAVVLHPGAHKGAGETEGIRKVIDMIHYVLEEAPDGPMLLLETTAGQGSSLGYTFEQLAAILEGIGRPGRMGICLDTCHIFAAGYDLRTAPAYEDTMDRFGGIIGFDRLKLIHVNDSEKDLGTRVDRHAHIGEGKIGREGFRLLMNDPRLAEIPKILETPKGSKERDWDAVNLKLLRKLASAGDNRKAARKIPGEV